MIIAYTILVFKSEHDTLTIPFIPQAAFHAFILEAMVADKSLLNVRSIAIRAVLTEHEFIGDRG